MPPVVRVEPGEEVLWRAAADVVAADRRVRTLEEQEAGPRSWEGYARVLWEAARHRDPEVRGALGPWTADPSAGAGARQLLTAWSGVLERSETLPAGWRAAAPAAREVTSVSGACDAVAAGGDVQRTGQELAAAVLQSRWAQPFDVWAAVRRAWSGVRDQGGEATAARAAAMGAVEAAWGGLRVRDVTALPEPARVAGAGFASPTQWADAEFQHRWQQYVVDCCARLEEALGAATPHGSDGRQLLLVSGWPLTSKRDAELAYLAQYEQHGPTVPFGGRRTGYGIEPDHAVVLAVPRFAARHATDHTRDDRQRIILGPDLGGGTAEPDERDVLALLRGAYPYLPADAEGDGPGARPTAMVTTAQAVRRAARLGRRAAYRGPEAESLGQVCGVGVQRADLHPRSLLGGGLAQVLHPLLRVAQHSGAGGGEHHDEVDADARAPQHVPPGRVQEHGHRPRHGAEAELYQGPKAVACSPRTSGTAATMTARSTIAISMLIVRVLSPATFPYIAKSAQAVQKAR